VEAVLESIAPFALFIAVFLVVSAPFLIGADHADRLVHGLLPFHVVITIAGELFSFSALSPRSSTW
jgi:cytochrome c oxidase assembly factor CtaG